MTEEDRDKLRNAELFVTYDIFAQDDNDQLYAHAVLGDEQSLQHANYLREAMKDWPEAIEEEED